MTKSRPDAIWDRNTLTSLQSGLTSQTTRTTSKGPGSQQAPLARCNQVNNCGWLHTPDMLNPRLRQVTKTSSGYYPYLKIRSLFWKLENQTEKNSSGYLPICNVYFKVSIHGWGQSLSRSTPAKKWRECYSLTAPGSNPWWTNEPLTASIAGDTSRWHGPPSARLQRYSHKQFHQKRRQGKTLNLNLTEALHLTAILQEIQGQRSSVMLATGIQYKDSDYGKLYSCALQRKTRGQIHDEISVDTVTN